MEVFGKSSDDKDVHRVKLSGGGLTAHIINWGAVVQDLRIEGHEPPLVLGFEAFDDYPAKSPYFGAIAGRFANRIAKGRFEIDGQEFQTDTNFLGKHTLHGGAVGIGKRLWEFADIGEDHATLRLLDRDGEMGFAGNLDILCTYRLSPPGRLVVELRATTDAPTLCNLAHHSYFNLNDGGSGDILGHRLRIDAESFLPVDEELIPTGAVQRVDGTPYDFRQARAIAHETDGVQQLYDHNYCLSLEQQPLRPVAWVQGENSGVELEVSTSEPGIQFYAGGGIKTMNGGLGGRAYQSHSGFCLEAQGWPDSPNQPKFPQNILRPGSDYRQDTEYRFQIG